MQLLQFFKKEPVLLLSSTHHEECADPDTEKPEIIVFHNESNAEKDVLNEKFTVYSTSRRINRWPLAIFFILLNISLNNVHVCNYSFPKNSVTTRLEFMKILARSLVKPYLNSRLPRELRLYSKNFEKSNFK